MCYLNEQSYFLVEQAIGEVSMPSADVSGSWGSPVAFKLASAAQVASNSLPHASRPYSLRLMHLFTDILYIYGRLTV